MNISPARVFTIFCYIVCLNLLFLFSSFICFNVILCVDCFVHVFSSLLLFPFSYSVVVMLPAKSEKLHD